MVLRGKGSRALWELPFMCSLLGSWACPVGPGTARFPAHSVHHAPLWTTMAVNFPDFQVTLFYWPYSHLSHNHNNRTGVLLFSAAILVPDGANSRPLTSKFILSGNRFTALQNSTPLRLALNYSEASSSSAKVKLTFCTWTLFLHELKFLAIRLPHVESL